MASETKKINKSDEEWQEQLSREEYEVTRKGGTEAPFTGRYWDNHDEGTYRCVACNARFDPDYQRYWYLHAHGDCPLESCPTNCKESRNDSLRVPLG